MESVESEHYYALNFNDIKKEKGMVKFIFSENYWAIQLDGATGKLLHIERRHSDIIENIFKY